MEKYATNVVSMLNVRVRGLSVLWSLQWLNLYPGLAVAIISTTGNGHELSDTDTVPMLLSADITERT